MQQQHYALRRTTTDNRAKYLEACTATRKLSEEARQKKWEEFLADLENNPDPTRAVRSIKSLSVTPSSSIFAEPLLHKGRTSTTNQGKANAFLKEYAAVNRLRFNKEERNRIRQLKSTLKSPTAGKSCCAALRKEELDEATLQMRAKGAPGPDDIPFVSQSPRAKSETGSARHLQPQLLHREVAPDLEDCHHLALKESGKTTSLHILM